MRDVEIPTWLKGMPLAPEFRPTDTEFADPIAYISKIEKEASAFGICKVIPPLPKPSRRYVLSNLNKSLSKCPELVSDLNSSDVMLKPNSGDNGNDGEVRAVFTTRHQELGQSVKRARGSAQPQLSAVHKQVWQSGEVYTVEQFESKSKAFARSVLGMIKDVSPLVVEKLFWKAASEKPIYVEYANDVPGSGFGEPKGQFRYFHKRRRKRKETFNRNNRVKSDCKEEEADTVGNPQYDGKNIAAIKNKPDSCLEPSNPDQSLEPSKASSSSSTLLSYETSRLSRQKCLDTGNEMEGTAGWKLSNSPWNLQIIARSPGSLTRFMPDDIPGVTSPMVYIGMLFSWFAWHVEDHELHSLNFLHTGSPKTWYAVPGEYAFAFEEVIRTQVYGGNLDRLGFNCGEAANFGTPQWLKVAKEAAVRRAAMNYLPMLSHQQLLYLLTMSFISRVPRSFLPGARSSRLRDRQKEERELLVKKAFIEDLLNENNLASVLLGKQKTYHVVLWDPESLPSPCKDSQLCACVVTDGPTPTENGPSVHSKSDNNQNDLFNQMQLYMETVNDLYVEDDLSCDFQVDSGTLACVACGILGFPFMSIVQPSEKASMQLLPANLISAEEGIGVSEPLKSHCPDLVDCFTGSSSGNLPSVPVPLPSENMPVPSITKFPEGWNTSNGAARPRIFCLEHAVQIEEMLQSKGGANVLVICHSDYKKIKAHAVAIAEEIGSCFDYSEISLDSASQEDLNLINLAIDGEDHNKCGEDWTSELGINLRYCVKVRKNSTSKQVKHALTLAGLFSDTIPSSDFLNLKWQFRKSRSMRQSSHRIHLEHSQGIQTKKDEGIQTKKDEVLGGKLDINMVRKEHKIIQYSRRSVKSRRGSSAGASQAVEYPKNFSQEEIPSANFGDSEKFGGSTSENKPENIEKLVTDSAAVDVSSFGNSEMEHEVQMLKATGYTCNDSNLVGNSADIYAAAIPVVESVQAQFQNLEENMENRVCSLVACKSSEVHHDVDTVESSEKIESSLAIATPTVDRFEMQIEGQIREQAKEAEETCGLVTLDSYEGLPQHDAKADGVFIKEVLNAASCPRLVDMVVGPCGVQINAESKKSCMNGEICGCPAFDIEVHQEIRPNEENGEVSVLNCNEPISLPSTVSMEGTAEIPEETCAGEDMGSDGGISYSQDNRNPADVDFSMIDSISAARRHSKRKREVELLVENAQSKNGFIRSPCEGLRPRVKVDTPKRSGIDDKIVDDKQVVSKVKKSSDGSVRNKGKKKGSVPRKDKKEDKKGPHGCDLEGCSMRFKTKVELLVHKSNRCPHKGCGKRFSLHKYAMLHQRVHDDERPLKCPWKGCTMSFKWAWARTEHLRVHTGERPYHCEVEGCGLAFRFISDFSRHRRKTGHYVNLPS
ncbi:lysine-specific demethylase ELF6 isoform X2 [Malania oleifera]|uniref:lysine-specific demethylase ELF6 isoform X2 n=1 Tax=Malania oleifera TaxID=397392 RepID=UPI0025AEC016|nr:lysine-specific demethylase ELF6 isoform X2 [Malania oleifera]